MVSNCNYIDPERSARSTDRVRIELYKENSLIDDKIGESILRTDVTDAAVWSGLESGTYYIEIIFHSSPVYPYESLRGYIEVDTYQ